jgi:predicted transcriptional regulator
MARAARLADIDPEAAVKMATDIVVAYLQQATISAAELPALVRQGRVALLEDAPLPALGSTDGEALNVSPPPERRVSIEGSITPDFLISFEDGKPYRSLRRHLMARYGMTPDDYRQKWGLPADYPMVAPNYPKDRAEVARRIGLGRNKPKGSAPVGKTRGRNTTPPR